MTPTAADVRREIETGPLAAELAPLWAAVFPAEPEPDPADAAAHARWVRIAGRFGGLTPDAAHDIAAALAGRAAELGWGGVQPHQIATAKASA